MSHREGKKEKKMLKSTFSEIESSMMAQNEGSDEFNSFQFNMSHLLMR